MTSAPVIDEQKHWDAVSAAIAAAAANLPVYDYGDTPANLPANFVMLAIERRYVPPKRNARAGRSGWRILLRYVGETAENVRVTQRRVTLALDEKRLTVDGVVSTPIQHESTTAPTEDDGRVSGRAEFTYAL